MFELEETYCCGNKALNYHIIKSGWWLFLISAILGYLTWQTNFGYLHEPTKNFLDGHPSWYLEVETVSLWFGLLSLSLILIGYLRAKVTHRQYKFRLDENAFHLKHGLFFAREINIPYHQISNVHIMRPYHYRMFGLAQLDIETASDKTNFRKKNAKNYLIPIIDNSLAKELSKQLIKYSSRSKKDEYTEEETEEDDTGEYRANY